jgi:tetratricopeptide (TPR) repeat protein
MFLRSAIQGDSMSTVSEALGLAVRRHQAGDLRKAELGYRQVLQVDPGNVHALHLLGLIAHQVGRDDSAVEYILKALRSKPDFAEAHNSLGMALQRQGQLEKAVASWRQAVSLRPDYAAAHNNLGIVYREQGLLDAAVSSYRQAVAIEPDFADAHNNLAVALHAQGLHDAAMASWRQAIRIRPDYVEAHFNLGSALYNLGRLDEAAASLEQALLRRPRYAEAHNNLGNVLRDQGRVSQAVAHYRQAVDSEPDFADAHNNLALAWLLSGNWELGWPEHEWRWKTEGFSPPHFHQPPWDGTSLGGRTILLHAEQGFGDTLQFVRFAQMTKQRGGTVLLNCQPALVPLLTSCPGIDRLIAQGDPLPDFDVHAPLMSLPGILATPMAAVSFRIPYLFADPGLIDRWQPEFQQPNTVKIGIAWQGNPDYRRDRQRSIPLAQFAPLARVAGTRLFSLQRGLGAEQLSALAEHVPVTVVSGNLDEASGAFMDTAAIMRNLDLIVTSDSAIAHLAGGLGIPVWLALPFAPDWRWLLQREDSPWYPTMRLFRQPEPGNWPAVFERMAVELLKAYPKTAGDCPNFAQSSEQNGTVPFSRRFSDRR